MNKILSEENKPSVVALVSGGLDSSTTMLKLAEDGFTIYPLIIKCNPKVHISELFAVDSIIEWMKQKYPIKNIEVIDISFLQKMREEDKSESEFFPFRNLIFASLGAFYAFSNQIHCIALGLCKPYFPDCKPEFRMKLEDVLSVAVEKKIEVKAPFINDEKAKIVEFGTKFDLPYKLTYSCYSGKEIHCGICGACKSRKIAFIDSGILDPTEYEVIGLNC